MPPTTRPSAVEWMDRKETIRNLYLGQDLALQVVQKQLEDHGFTATKAQYEAKFKEWGFSKNVPVNTWKHIGLKIGKRKREGKESAVFINGIEVCLKRVKKETSRHYYSVIERTEAERNNAPSPQGPLTVVSTPPCQQEVLILNRWPSNLPWFLFIKFLDTRLEGLPRMQLNPQTFQDGLLSTQNKFQANDILGGKAPRTEISGVRQLVFDTIKEYAPSDLNHALLPFSSDVEWPAAIDPSMSLESTSSNHWGLKMLIYLASNRLLESSNLDVIWKMIEKAGILQLANFSNSSYARDRSLTAAMECLFETGIHEQHEDLVRWLLDAGMEPNTKINLKSAEIEVHLPLIVVLSSTHWRAPRMVQLLLSKGSSPVLICCKKHGSPTQFLIRSCKEEEDDEYLENRKSFWDVFSKVMEILDQHPESQPLRHGDEFNIDLSALWQSLNDEDSDLDENSDDESPDIYQLIELIEAVATRTSNPGASVITPTCLIGAAENHHDGLLMFMHKRGQKMDCCDESGRFPLLAALEVSEFKDYEISQNVYMSNVELLLELGASPNYNPSSQDHAGCSPALQAALHNDAHDVSIPEAIKLLTQSGAHAQGLPTCGKKNHLSLMDCARSHKNWDPQELTEVLISLHHAGLPLPEWSLISVLELAYENDFYKNKGKLHKLFSMLFETAPGICSDLSIRSKRGWPVLDYSVLLGERQLAQLLVQHGAKLMSRAVYLNFLAEDFSTHAVIEIVSRLGKPKIEQSRDLIFHRLIRILRIPRPMIAHEERLSDLIRQYCIMPRSSDQNAYLIDEVCSGGHANFITITMEMLPNTYSSAAVGTLFRSRKLDANHRRIFIHELLGRRPRTPLKWSTETSMVITVFDQGLRRWSDEAVLESVRTHDKKIFENANVYSSEFALQYFARKSIQVRDFKQLVTQWVNRGLKASSYHGIMIACTGMVEDMSALLDHGFQPNRRLCWSLTALQIAVARGDKPMTLRLIDAGCDVNAPPPWKDIPKSIYKRIQHDVRKVLTSNEEQTRRRTALQLAVEEGNISFTKMLLDFDANVNGQAARVGGATALQIACIKGYIEIARLLISKGADMNAPGAEYFGRTALEGAAENGRLDIVGLLFEHGCRVDDCFRREYIRAVGFAKAQGNHALSKFLQDFGEWKKADEEILREIDLKDEEPDSRDLEEEWQEDEDVSEVDEDEFECYVEDLLHCEPGESSDSEDHSTTSEEGSTTPSSMGSPETEYSDQDELIDDYMSQEEELL